MTNLDAARLEARVTRHEGLRLKAYDDRTGEEVKLADPSRLTIGIGRNLQDVPLELDVAELMLSHDLSRASSGALAIAPFYGRLSAIQKEVLVEMVFQMGELGVARFLKFLEAARVGNNEEAARQMLDSKWAREDSPSRASELAALWRSSDDLG